MVGDEPKSSSTPTISMQAQASSQIYPPSPPSLPTFEFTKRKRWADLLITELTEAIILILSTQCQILYCNVAVKELLGWRDEDLIDTEFLDLVNGTWMCPVWSLTRL
jgi:PAS domain-containing protein